jgi:hypothetical protein
MATRELVRETLFPGLLYMEKEEAVVPDRSPPLDERCAVVGYRFVERDRFDTLREDGKTVTTHEPVGKPGPWTYIGERLSLAKVQAMQAEDPERWRILRSNMEGNGYEAVVRTRHGQCLPLEADDVVVSP